LLKPNQKFHPSPLNLSSLKLDFIPTAVIISKDLYLMSQILNHSPYRNIINCFHYPAVNHLYSDFIINHQFFIPFIIVNYLPHPN